jgi:hypothetical protein
VSLSRGAPQRFVSSAAILRAGHLLKRGESDTRDRPYLTLQALLGMPVQILDPDPDLTVNTRP